MPNDIRIKHSVDISVDISKLLKMLAMTTSLVTVD